MTSVEEADSWIGRTAVDNTGEQIGRITQIWVDDASGQPSLASVKGAALGRREALVPIAGSVALGGGRKFAYSKEEVVDAPNAAQDGHLATQDKEQVSAYYGVTGTEPVTASPSAGWSGRQADPLQTAAEPAQSDEKAPRRFRRKPSPPAPSDEKATRRFRRKPSPPSPSDQKAKRRFRRKPAAGDELTDEQTAAALLHGEEVPAGR